MAYEVVMPYHLHMPSYFLETFTEYPCLCIRIETFRPCSNKNNETVSYSYSETVSFDFNIKYFISV